MALFWGKEDAPAIRRPSGTIPRGARDAFVWSTGDALRESAEHVSFGSEADIDHAVANVRFGPKADVVMRGRPTQTPAITKLVRAKSALMGLL